MPEYCVTGGTGLIAAYLIKSLLEKGHTVRTTARDPGTICDFLFYFHINMGINSYIVTFFFLNQKM